MSKRASELGRIDPTGLTVTVPIPEDDCVVVVLNQLSAPLYGTWSTQATPTAPSAAKWDVAVPGSAYMTLLVPEGAKYLRLLAIYPGAVPAADAAAIVLGSPCPVGPFVGALV